jgi:hypothetical protein
MLASIDGSDKFWFTWVGGGWFISSWYLDPQFPQNTSLMPSGELHLLQDLLVMMVPSIFCKLILKIKLIMA